MVCVYCGQETQVINSRPQKRANQIWRRRKCLSCGAVFTSNEAIDLSSTILVEHRGSTHPFVTDLLFTELLLALQDQKDCYLAAREVTSTVVKELLKLPEKPVFKSHKISEVTAKILKRFNKRAWLRYTAEHPSLQK